jgi:RNA recognition motif-containing protein
MAKNLFIGSLPFAVDDQQLRELFEPFGTVDSAKVIMDRETGRSRGFGFVEMSTEDEAKAAIDGMNGKEVSGRSISVNEARPREERPRGR